VTYSYTQLAHYLACPLRYRYRYLDGWQEKETRAGLLFGRAFEQALGALFRREDPACALFDGWSKYKDVSLEYPNNESWEQMLEQGIHLLERFVQDNRVHIRNPRRNLQIKFSRAIGIGNEFIAYIDAIGQLDGERSVIDWKTTGVRYPEQPVGLLALDPQLVCYSWITGEPNVGFVVFVRKRLVEVQYLRSTITQQQRDNFAVMVANTIGQIESAHFPARSGIRFPQNGCLSCAHLGLCLGKQELVDSKLIRRPGADLGWLDELDY
jgi:PD-(D/E)XK nuclease superfamily protein